MYSRFVLSLLSQPYRLHQQNPSANRSHSVPSGYRPPTVSTRLYCLTPCFNLFQVFVPLTPFPPAVPYTPSTQRVYDERPDQPVLFPPPGQPFQVVASPRPGLESDGRREGLQQQGQPIIIHPPPQSHITPGPYGPPGQGIIVPPPHSQSRSTTPTTESSRSPGPFVIAGPYPPTMFPGGPGGPFPGGPFPGGPFPGGVPLQGVPLPMPGMGMIPPSGPPITVVAPSRVSRSPEPEYRSPRDSPRPSLSLVHPLVHPHGTRKAATPTNLRLCLCQSPPRSTSSASRINPAGVR
jgi:hypothetical protein